MNLADLKTSLAVVQAKMAKSSDLIRNGNLDQGQFNVECDWFDHLTDIERDLEVQIEKLEKVTQ